VLGKVDQDALVPLSRVSRSGHHAVKKPRIRDEKLAKVAALGVSDAMAVQQVEQLRLTHPPLSM